jgi:hypothetical protein
VANDHFKDPKGNNFDLPAPTVSAAQPHETLVGSGKEGYWVYVRESTVAGVSTWRAVRFEPPNTK